MTSTITAPPHPALTETDLARRWAASYPEAAGPGTDHESGLVTYDQPPNPRVGTIPHMLDPAIAAREDNERYLRWLAMTPAERYAWEGVRQVVREEMGR